MVGDKQCTYSYEFKDFDGNVVSIADEKSVETSSNSNKIDSDPFKEFMQEKNVTLLAKDVQFDMSNQLDKQFAISGTAELDDYYNYGFTNDKDYFCVHLTQDDGSYKNSWYLYLHRDSFAKLYDKLKEGNVHFYAICKIPASVYEKNQGNMAVVESVRW